MVCVRTSIGTTPCIHHNPVASSSVYDEIKDDMR